MSGLSPQDQALLDWLRKGPKPGTRRPDMEYEALVELLRPLQNADRVSEREWLTIVQGLAKAYGWRTHHANPGKTVRGKWVTTGSPGFPDLVMVKPGHAVVFLELKTTKGQTSPRQVAWMRDIQSVGGRVEGYVVSPRQVRQLVELLAEDPERV